MWIHAFPSHKPSCLIGTCVVKDGHPAAQLTWTRNGKPLVADGKAVVISPSVKMEPATKLSTSFSTLQYTATMEDTGATFACSAAHPLGSLVSTPEVFPVHYPTEKLSLQVLSKGPIVEGDNVTLKCHADGNPPPRRFNFHLKASIQSSSPHPVGKKVLVEDSDSHTLVGVTRASTGEYKCSLADNDSMEAAEDIADGQATQKPEFGRLTYADAGVYTCEVATSGDSTRLDWKVLPASRSRLNIHSTEAIAGVKRLKPLTGAGSPVITSLTKQRADKHKVLTCEAQGVPEPSFQWSVNGTH
ncbi:hypothetical protein CRUP_033703, partial [Coryphaenoides rupestris]